MASGIVALLDRAHTARIEALWREFQDTFGVPGVSLVPYPHFSLLVAETFDAVLTESYLKRVAAQMPPLTIRTAGLGIFTGLLPVLHVTVVRDAPLTIWHGQIWEKLTPVAAGVQTYYHPDHWQPHITIALDDMPPEKLPQVIELLYARDFNWTIQVDRLAFIADTGTGQPHTLQSEYPLTG